MSIAYHFKRKTRKGKVWHFVSNTRVEHRRKMNKYKNMGR